MNFSTTTGEETFSKPIGASIKITAYYKRDGAASELPFFIAGKDKHSGCNKINSPEFIPASPLNTHHGQWILANFSVPERSLAKIGIRKGGNGGFPQVGAFMLLQRPHAALRRMKIPLTGNPNANQPFAYFEGRFDYINPDNFEALGIDPGNRSYLNQFDVDYTDYFEDEILEGAIAPLVIPKFTPVVQPTGKVVHVLDKGARRVLQVRRR